MSGDTGMGGPDPWEGLRLEGERIYLRPLQPEDATERYAGWLNDPETTKYLETSGPQSVDSVRRYIEQRGHRKDVLFLAIILKEGEIHIGNVELEPIDWRNRRATLGIMVGERDARGKGLGTEAILLVLQYAFETLGLHRVELGVRADNEVAIRCYRKIGFVEEGRHREGTWRDGEWVDGIWMSILDREFCTRTA